MHSRDLLSTRSETKTAVSANRISQMPAKIAYESLIYLLIFSSVAKRTKSQIIWFLEDSSWKMPLTSSSSRSAAKLSF